MLKETKNRKLKAKEKLALALFMEAVPKLLEIWQRHAPELSFDAFCQREYDNAKNNK